MLHWAKSYAAVAALAGMGALAAYPSPLGVVAVFLVALFVTLAVLSLITGAVGRRRDGTYSVERALALVAMAVAAAWLSHGWLAMS